MLPVRCLMFFLRRGSFLALGLALASVLSACALFHEGAPVATRKVQADTGREVESVASDSFNRRGYRVVSSTGRRVTFERVASKTDEVVYGSWGESKSMERVVLSIEETSFPNVFRISCQPFTVRDPGTGMEDVSRRLQVFSRDYDVILKEIDTHLKEGAALSR